jgi:hypothetical protein
MDPDKTVLNLGKTPPDNVLNPAQAPLAPLTPVPVVPVPVQRQSPPPHMLAALQPESRVVYDEVIAIDHTSQRNVQSATTFMIKGIMRQFTEAAHDPQAVINLAKKFNGDAETLAAAMFSDDAERARTEPLTQPLTTMKGQPMITISPTSAALKFGGTQKFTSSEPGKYTARSQNGSTVDADGTYHAGQPVNATEQSASDTVTVTANIAANGSASASVSLSK